MISPDPEYLLRTNDQGEQRRLAYINTPALDTKTAGLVWLNGLNSAMTSTKATALADWAAAKRRSLLRFDYSGHGQSDGEFNDGTIGQWLGDTIAVLENIPQGPQILVGSSMGGWIALLVLRAIARKDPVAARLPKIAGVVLIAPAWDMTEELMWNQFSGDQQAEIERNGYFDRPSHYGDAPYRITEKLIKDGRNHLIGGSTFRPPCPVRVLQGILDPDVPWQHANKLTHILEGDNIMVVLVHDGQHRLSRPEDIARLFQIMEELDKSIESGSR